ncbi:MAG: tetratricopeptide repeat protein [Flavobacteriales bacterium]
MDLVNAVLKEDPNIAHGYFLKGWIHMETHDTARAISSFRTAVEQDPQDYDAYIMLGKISAAKHDPLAAQYYATATTLRPRSIEAWYNKGIYHQDHGEDSLALDCYAHILAIDPGNALAYYNTGWVKLEHLNDLNGAKHDFSQAIALQPNYFNAWYNRGVAMERMAQLDSAAANYQVTLSIAPNHPLAIEALDRLQSKGVWIKMRDKKPKA